MASGLGRCGSYGSSLRDLPRLRTHRRLRESSWDRTGGNDDRITVRPGETVAHSAPYHGLRCPGGDSWSGQISMYRFHVEDPVTFTTSIRVTIEHGHANKRSDDLSSTAYWYQETPATHLMLLPVAQRLPRLG